MKKTLLSLLTILCFSFIQAQSFENEGYNWSADPKPFVPSKEDKAINEIGLKDMRIVEIASIGNQAVQLFVRHSIKFINSDDAIERNNKISLPYSTETNIVESKVRVIQPDGTVIELGSNDIKEAEDETSKRKYKYFAVRGLVIGSVIEQLFIKKTVPDLTGATYNMQFTFPNRNASFAIIYPDNLIMQTQSYAGYPDFKTDTTIADKIRKYVDSTDIPALAEENYSNYNANVQRISFKLSGNKASGKLNLYAFSKWGENVYNNLNPVLEKGDMKMIEKYLKGANLGEASSTEDKIRKVEAFIKKNKFVSDNANVEKADIATLINTKVLGKFEMTRLFCYCLNYLNINHQEVVTNDRFDQPFDPKFENYQHLQEFAIYFPDQNKYMAPTEIFMRYPFLPHGWINNYGLFIKPIKLGDVTMGITEKKLIPALDYTYSVDTMEIKVDMTKDISTPTYNYTLSYAGYDAQNYQPGFDFMSDEDKEKLRKSIVSSYVGDKDEIKLTTENEGMDALGFKPFVIHAEITTPKLSEKVGEQYLFKVGETIGRQVEMYQEGTRKTPLELDECHGYYRYITVIIPDGYKVTNLDKLNMNFVVTQDGKEVTAFKSSYTLTGNVLKISNFEYYNAIQLPIQQYEPYKMVVNAAADFNKIVLVLDKM